MHILHKLAEWKTKLAKHFSLGQPQKLTPVVNTSKHSQIFSAIKGMIVWCSNGTWQSKETFDLKDLEVTVLQN